MNVSSTFQGIDVLFYMKELNEHKQALESALPRLSPFDYGFKNNKDEQRFNISKWIRNVAALENYSAFLLRLQEFFLAAEFFQGKIELTRKEQDFEIGYKKQLFTAIASDSLRSSLDILAKSISWFYDLDAKDNVGFSYKDFLKPLKQHSECIFKEATTVYQSSAYKVVKDFRNAEKHSGLSKREISLKNIGQKFEANIINPEVIDFHAMENACCQLLKLIATLSNKTVCEFLKHDRGYDASNDRFCKLDHESRLVLI